MIAAFSRQDPSGQVDPRDLSTSQISALRLFASARMVRVGGGWRGRGTRRVSLTLAGELAVLGLVRVEAGSHMTMAITGKGRLTLHVADVRAEQRRAARG